MKRQNVDVKNDKIKTAFLELKQNQPERLKRRLELSWCNCFSGTEPLQDQAKRLQKAGISYIELHGNHYESGIGYDSKEVMSILSSHGIQVSGVVALSSPERDLASESSEHRQAAIDYLKREIEFAAEVSAGYLDIIPSALGRTVPYDDREMERSADSIRQVGEVLLKNQIKGAIEPINSFEVSLIHSVTDARKLIKAIHHSGIIHINGDLYHMQIGENHIGKSILDAGESLINLHIVDSNRDAIGLGSMDIDTIIMALYLNGHNQEGKYVTGEPLGKGRTPLEAITTMPDPHVLDRLVQQTASYFREREEELLK